MVDSRSIVSDDRFIDTLLEIKNKLDAMNTDSKLCKEMETLLSAIEEHEREVGREGAPQIPLDGGDEKKV